METGQPVVDLSGLVRKRIRFGNLVSRESKYNPAIRYEFGGVLPTRNSYAPFPPNSVGIFYFRQSYVSRGTLGEIRFRLCSDSTLFAEGVDLCFGSGDPWFLPVASNQGLDDMSAARQLLYEEGLLVPRNNFPPSGTSVTGPTLLTASDPFVVDLSQWTTSIHLKANSGWSRIKISPYAPQYTQNSRPAYRGKSWASCSPDSCRLSSDVPKLRARSCAVRAIPRDSASLIKT